MKLSLPRIWVGDLLHFAHRIPTVPVERKVNIASLVQARRLSNFQTRWVSVFLKAYALVAVNRPKLRQAYLSWPWAHLWQHPVNVVSVAITRDYHGEPAVFFAKLREPENCTLPELDAFLDTHANAPIESIGAYRRLIRTSRLPKILRRAVWSAGLNWSGALREKNFGTFGVSVYSSTGTDSQHPMSPLTTLFNYSPISANGDVTLRIVYDHRVMDGLEIAHALREIEETLQGTILAEIRELATHTQSKAA
ncbi:MAG: hypothetical protein ACRC8S_16900 [Fimbriiglobus sp.]